MLAFLMNVAISCKAQEDIKKLEVISKKMLADDYDGAKKDIEKYLGKNTKNITAWILAGHIYSELDEDSLAIVSYEKALDLDKNTEQAFTGLGIVYRKQNDNDKAAFYYYKALEVNPDYAQAYSSLVIIELKRKNFSKAIEVGQKAYDLEKTDPVIAANLAVAYHYSGDTTNRDKYFEKARALGYKSLEALKKVFSGELSIID
jgi:Flp pilus assembly protein TadD